ncbi:MAG: CooT family nickel-binding protein [Treponema sp.]|nr:CooT family nickel-binding protein [Treponema sp.]
MCLSTVYELGTNGTKKKLCEYVSAVKVSGDTVTLTDIMGKEIRVSGALEQVDLVKNTIIIGSIPRSITETAGRVPEKAAAPVKTYEVIREIFNSCSNNQMRDVDIREVETNDVDTSVQEFLVGEKVRCEKFVKDNGIVVFDIDTDGMQQRVTFTELTAKS